MEGKASERHLAALQRAPLCERLQLLHLAQPQRDVVAVPLEALQAPESLAQQLLKARWWQNLQELRGFAAWKACEDPSFAYVLKVLQEPSWLKTLKFGEPPRRQNVA